MQGAMGVVFRADQCGVGLIVEPRAGIGVLIAYPKTADRGVRIRWQARTGSAARNVVRIA